jgi:DNA repair ATPase RecN
MRLKMDEQENMMVLSVRGVVEPKHLRMLIIGCESMLKKKPNYMIFNFARAQLSDSEAVILNEIKKKLEKHTTGKMIWISKKKPLGDFQTADLYFSRLTGSKSRQLAEKITLDDTIDELYELKQNAELKLKNLIGDDENTHQQALIENQNLKIKKAILTEQNKSLKKWHDGIKPILSTNEEIKDQLETARQNFKDALVKISMISNSDKLDPL